MLFQLINFLHIFHIQVYMHQMRCLEALGQWSELNALGKKAFSLKTEVVVQERRQKMAVIAARGSWAVGIITFIAIIVIIINYCFMLLVLLPILLVATFLIILLL